MTIAQRNAVRGSLLSCLHTHPDLSPMRVILHTAKSKPQLAPIISENPEYFLRLLHNRRRSDQKRQTVTLS